MHGINLIYTDDVWNFHTLWGGITHLFHCFAVYSPVRCRERVRNWVSGDRIDIQQAPFQVILYGKAWSGGEGQILLGHGENSILPN